MCSVTGWYRNGAVGGLSKEFIRGMASLLQASEIRGRDGFGFATATFGKQVPFTDLTIDGYEDELSPSAMSRYMIANHRAEPTTEHLEQKTYLDQQPYAYKGWECVHNGTIANDKMLLEAYKVIPPTSIDSYAIPVAVYHEGSVEAGLKVLRGSYATLLWHNDSKQMWAGRNYKPLNIFYLPKEKVYILSSLADADVHFDRWQNDVKRIPFPPYSIAHFKTDGTLDVTTTTPQNRKRALVVCSGGLDSVTVAKIAAQECDYVKLIHFRYGCKAEKKEMEAVVSVAKELNVDFEFIDMGWLKNLGGSALTDDERGIALGVSGAEFAHEWVPARNTAMIGITASYADRYDMGRIYLGLNLEEGGAYPDNTVEFYTEFNKVLDCGTQARPEIVNPLATLTKKEIVALAHKVQAPIHLAWSCYKGGEKHCGQCGPCHMRRVAHQMLGLDDSMQYEQEMR